MLDQKVLFACSLKTDVLDDFLRSAMVQHSLLINPLPPGNVPNTAFGMMSESFAFITDPPVILTL